MALLSEGDVNWAVGKGRAAYPGVLAGKEPGGFGYGLADKLVLSKVREGLGGRVRYCISGGAPLPPFVNQFFHSLGVWMLSATAAKFPVPPIQLPARAP